MAMSRTIHVPLENVVTVRRLSAAARSSRALSVARSGAAWIALIACSVAIVLLTASDLLPQHIPSVGPVVVTSHAGATFPVSSGMHVSGNQLVDAQGRPVILRGVDRSGAEYACIHDVGVFDGPSDDVSVRAMVGWRVAAVRVPLNEDCWLGINGAPATYSGLAYRREIVRFAALLNHHGIVAILELHWNAPGSHLSVGQQPMPDRDHAADFWRQVADAFKDDPSVMFDLYNEPAPDDGRDSTAAWRCWRDGGTCPGVGYQTAGMQELVTAIRRTGAANVLLLGGVRWANALSRWLMYQPSDPAHNLVAAWHVYDTSPCRTIDCYNATVAPVLASSPLLATEIGEADCAHSFVDATMDWLDSEQTGYLAWSWNVASCAAFPALISNYDGTPTAFGVGVKDHIADLLRAPVSHAVSVPADVDIKAPFALSAITVKRGDSLTASVTLRNRGSDIIALLRVVLAGRQPGSAHGSSNPEDFGSAEDVILTPGQSITVRGTRVFTPTNPLGHWYGYLTYVTADGRYHDVPPDVGFNVTSE